MSVSSPPHPVLRPGTLLMYEALDQDSKKVWRREFIIVVRTFMHEIPEGTPSLAYVGFSSLDGRCVRFAEPIYEKKKYRKSCRWTFLVP